MDRRDLLDELKGKLKKIERKKRAELNPKVIKIAESNNRFALDLYNHMNNGGENLFFSPFSVYTALSMVYTGARGLTKTQMGEKLYVSMELKLFHSTLESLLEALSGEDDYEGFELHLANLVAIKKDYEILDEYLTLIESIFNGNIWKIIGEFSLKINAWVSEQTRGKITEIIDSQSVTPETTLILLNTIYFKGSWQHQFKESVTRDDEFTLLDGNKVFIPIMHQVDVFHYFESKDLQVLEMIYEGRNEQLSMVVFLPKEFNGLIEFEKSLTYKNLSKYILELYTRRVEVFFPRFRFEKKYSLMKSLIKLGISNPFTLDADFSGITDSPEGLFIEEVLHKAFIDVDEKGTEAAAVTAVIMAPTGPPIKREPPPIFRADHPFLFLIRDMQTKTILFIGKVLNPQ
ncbi:MAG: serpin family protein [Candidatus Hodarchaeota archaeon]